MATDRFAQPIVALATPYAAGALAVIRTSGAGAVEMVDALFSPRGRLAAAGGYTVHHGRLVQPTTDSGGKPGTGVAAGDEVLDEVLATVFRAPHSYTGEDSVEISCHGSPAGIDRILAALCAAGFRPADPGEFTLRAFLAGKIDLTRAEAVQEIVSAQTREAHAMALQRLSGAVEERINDVKGRLVSLLAAIDIQLDYPEEDTGEIVVPPESVREVEELLRSLLAGWRTGRIYQEGVRVAIAGRTNAGKSSLFNALLRQDRAIVSAIAGTTRDYLEAPISLSGVPARIFDTAGFRDTIEEIESEGIRRSGEILDSADLVVWVVDASTGNADTVAGDADAAAEALVIERLRAEGRLVGAWNKVDLGAGGTPPPDFLPVSVKTGAGMDELLQALARTVLPESLAWTGEPVIDSLRQKELLERALQALGHVREGLAEQVPVDTIALDMEEAVRALGEITGEVTSDDVLDAMFRGFCVGK
ncbi:MAG: tRNA uridine-5-carboxymethylaminomethyl(34) synthesis GTPase MnmE [Spirochaetaceae bacterium]|nr:MAG: tRNA uridine-5-carboxymethylaminomethyl(34) synthesis GTPase MnmE [Spirochaetaceae bacterium]